MITNLPMPTLWVGFVFLNRTQVYYYSFLTRYFDTETVLSGLK